LKKHCLTKRLKQFSFEFSHSIYAGIAHVSRATAQKELADLVHKGVLGANPGGGRSASYDIVLK
jgi:Fic family protein